MSPPIKPIEKEKTKGKDYSLRLTREVEQAIKSRHLLTIAAGVYQPKRKEENVHRGKEAAMETQRLGQQLEQGLP